MHVHVEEDILELKPAGQTDGAPRDVTPVQSHAQPGRALLVALGANLHANGNLVSGERDVLHDDVADRNVVRIGQPHRHREHRHTAYAEIPHHGVGTPRRCIHPVGEKHDAAQWHTPARPRYRLQGIDDGCPRVLRRETGQQSGRPDGVSTEHQQPCTEGVVIDLQVVTQRRERAVGRTRKQACHQVRTRGGGDGFALRRIELQHGAVDVTGCRRREQAQCHGRLHDILRTLALVPDRHAP